MFWFLRADTLEVTLDEGKGLRHRNDSRPIKAIGRVAGLWIPKLGLQTLH